MSSRSRNFAPYLPASPPTVTIVQRGGRESLEDFGLRSDISKALAALEDVGGLVDAAAIGQDEWYINATTGSDDNDGKTSATALASFREWSRRTGTATLLGPTTVYIETDLDEPTTFAFRGSYLLQGLTVIGTRTVIGTGTFSGVQDYDDSVSPGDDGQITDAALPVSWTDSGFVEKLIVLTSGANPGALAWVVKDLGAKTARTTPFWNPGTFAFIDPQVGEDYEVVTIPRLANGLAVMSHRGRIVFQSIDFDGGTFLSSFGQDASTVVTEFSRIGGFSGFQFGGSSGGSFNVCLFQTTNNPFSVGGGTCTLLGCCIGERVSIDAPSVILTVDKSIAQFGLGSGDALGLDLSGGGTVHVPTGSFFAVFDSDQADDAAFVVRSGGIVRLEGKVWGLDWDNGFGLWLDSGGQILYPSPDNFTAHADVQGAGQVAEVRYGRTNTTYAAIGVPGVVNAANNAMVVPSEFGP